jgi:hypothetical protein
VGVAEWETAIVEELPTDLQASLPTVAEIEAELGSLQEQPAHGRPTCLFAIPF